MAGPQRARLDTALTAAHEQVVAEHSMEWTNCVRTLSAISRALLTASPEVKEQIGGETGPAIDRAFAKSAQGMEAKAQELVRGSGALQAASEVITQARQEQASMDADTREKPGEYHPPVGQPTDEDLQKEAANKQAHAAYNAWQADQERRAQIQADRMDRVFEQSTAVMKDIHKIPDPPPRPGDPGGGPGGPGGGSGPGPAQAPAPAGGGSGPRPPQAPGPYDPPGPGGGGPGPGYQPGPGGGPIPVPGGGAPQGGSPIPIDYTPGGGTGVPGTIGSGAGSGSSGSGGLGGSAVGVAGAAAGGLGGGMLASGLAAGLRGGMTTPVVAAPGTAASGVRGIGATGRTGISGALGGKPGVAAVSPGAGGTAAGRGTAATRGTAAGRGGRGGVAAAAGGSRSGTGAGGTAAGRTGNRKDDEKRRKRDLFDASEDWVDDEDAAPSVID